MRRFASFLLALLLLVPLVQGCAPKGYTHANTNRIFRSVEGVVLEAREVTIKGGEEGATLGGIVGLIIGSQFGKGKGSVAAALGGGLLGSLLGAQASTRGQQLTIRLQDGSTITTVIKVDERHYFRSGDRVRLVLDGNKIVEIELR
ncbi:MAG: hypothetical protein C6I00_07440 [Nitratiruptor sp.]|nr:hypothetical protein [Nitratiruptor sp.]NPA82923.1 glycine zipper 2TM domain-containing protein [Campylobacterota bacterium]